MRSDMDKVLVEKERYHSSFPNWEVRLDRRTAKTSDNEELGSLPKKASMRPKNVRAKGCPKELSENLNPLVKFLHKSVGRKWDKVYSEIKRVVDARSAVQAHIFQHLFWYVHTDVRMLDGHPYDPNHSYERVHYLYDNGSTFYVDPDSGKLLKPKKKRVTNAQRRNNYKKRDSDKNRCEYLDQFGNKVRFVREKGLWYYEDLCLIEWFSSEPFYTKTKQLSKKDLKYYGLKNEVLI